MSTKGNGSGRKILGIAPWSEFGWSEKAMIATFFAGAAITVGGLVDVAVYELTLKRPEAQSFELTYPASPSQQIDFPCP